MDFIINIHSSFQRNDHNKRCYNIIGRHSVFVMFFMEKVEFCELTLNL